MAKYRNDYKRIIIHEYLDGNSRYKTLAKKYGVKVDIQIRNWGKSYEKYGVKGVFRKKSKEVYSFQFKLDVHSFMKRTGISLNETALHMTSLPFCEIKKRTTNDAAPCCNQMLSPVFPVDFYKIRIFFSFCLILSITNNK
ncbi:helix-turn-helix domain-containing protein [Sporosarcina sp. FSL W7-1283]|uniref:helix-turn-helix domain-containing protein n=1 Tax=Sporosarcina sp. FSL W7-1283 TaxID=2921560 RepID=UPI0030FBD13D